MNFAELHEPGLISRALLLSAVMFGLINAGCDSDPVKGNSGGSGGSAGQSQGGAGGEGGAAGMGGGGGAAGGPIGPPEPGWNAGFVIDPVSAGLNESLVWDFTLTKLSGSDPLLVSSNFENASNPTAPVSGPGVGRSLFTDTVNDGATWYLNTPFEARRVYFRSMFSVSANYSVSTAYEGYFSMPQRMIGGGTLGQSTIDFRTATSAMNEAETQSLPISFSVGVQTPNGPVYMQNSGPEFKRGTWHQIEAYFVTSTPGNADGTARVWLDGSIIIDKTDIKWALNAADFVWSGLSWLDRRVSSDYPLPAKGQYRETDHVQLFWSQTRE